MSEYWKSNPRKYCDFCKCWIADNKPSVEFHERGKRHKESVAQKLEQIGKKGKEDFENQLKQDDYFKEMEMAALEAYKKDIEANPDYTGSKIAQIAESSNLKIVIGGASSCDDKPKPPIKPETPIKPSLKWFEAKSEDGISYYWNTVTGESVWEAPKEGFLNLEEQNEKTNAKETAKKSRSSKSKKKLNENVTSNLSVFGPQPKAQPYGAWEAAVIPENEVDLQLPELPEEEYYAPELVIKKPEIKFTERTVTLSKDNSISSGPVSFKRRKGAEEHKKNVRQRTAEL